MTSAPPRSPGPGPDDYAAVWVLHVGKLRHGGNCDVASGYGMAGGGVGGSGGRQAKLHEEAYTREEVEEIVGVKLADLFAASAPSLGVLSVATTFKLNQRARHVYAEARRVHAFRQVASLSEAAQGSGAEDDVLDKLGNLMNDSHLSCSQLYDCSCPELEELVQVCRRNGALGARLTGAGWGGCTVSLVPDARAPAFIEALKEEFYKARVEAGAIKKEDLDVYVFASKPAGGAAIFKN
eukprot:jgi/Mesen1/1187/ME000127S00220